MSAVCPSGRMGGCSVWTGRNGIRAYRRTTMVGMRSRRRVMTAVFGLLALLVAGSGRVAMARDDQAFDPEPGIGVTEILTSTVTPKVRIPVTTYALTPVPAPTYTLTPVVPKTRTPVPAT